MLNLYFNRIRHLRIAQPIINDIVLLNNALVRFNRKSAISTISYITLKYEKELDKIAIYLSGRPIIKGQVTSLYAEHTEENLIDDIDYLISCIIIIGAVRFGVVKNIEEAIINISND